MSTRRIACLVGAATVLALTARLARTRRVDHSEERAFRAVNNAPAWLHVPVWGVMQAGSLGAVFVVAAAVRSTRNGAATRVLLAGTAAWFGAKLAKPLVGRGRPEDYLDDVIIRGSVQSGLGFPSGHAAVATTLALAATSPSSPARVGALVGALATGVARLYVGAHLPLDVVGGLAAGVIIGVTAS
jgi:undecaprenyl-diphosphatase